MNQARTPDRRPKHPLFSSIRFRLPFFVALLTAGVFVAFLFATYIEVDEALLQTAGPQAEAAARGFVNDMALLTSLYVVVAGLVSAAVTTRIVRPLAALTRASEAIAGGDFNRRVSGKSSDEIGRLARAFNGMVEQIRDGRERLIERAQHATCLAEVASALTAGKPLAAIMEQCAAAIAEHLPVTHVTVWTVGPGGGWLDRQGSAGGAGPFGRAYDRVPIGALEIGVIAQSRIPVVTNDVAANPQLQKRMWSAGAAAFAFAGYPLVVNEDLVGVMAMIADEPLSDRGQDTLALMAQTVAVGIARKQLEDSRTQMASILDSAADFVTIGQTHGPPIYVNRAARRALGIGETETVSSLMAFRPPAFRTHFEGVLLAQVKREGSWSGESEYVSRGGRIIPVSQVSVGHQDSSGKLLYLSTIARDISDQKLAETALRDSEGRFRLIAETITEVFWIADVGLSRITYISPGYERVWGRSCASLYARPRSFVEAVHPDDQERVLSTLRVQTTGEPFDHEYRIVRPDGEIRWVWDRGFPITDPQGRVLQYVGASQDITDRKRADAHVGLLARAIESTGEMVSVTDLDDHFTFVNRAFRQTYGYSEEEVIGHTPTLLRPGDQYEDLFNEVSRETRRGGWAGELPIRCKDGSEVVVSLHTSLIRDHSGQTIGLLGVARDITLHRSLEDQLRQSQKMEAIGQLAGGIAHDFNNLLTAILGNAALLDESLPEEDARRRDVEQIRYAADRATALTRQLLAFSRKQILAPQILRLGDVVRQLMPMLRRVLGEQIDLKTNVADHGSVKADTGQLEQVLINLAVNARDAMPDGGRLTVETADVTLDDGYRSRHAGVKAGPYVMLAVSDSGHGMDAATQQRVFEPFFTTKASGTGLGLATVHGIVSQSGGHIWLYSEIGKGTTFKVYFPRTDEALETAGTPAFETRAQHGEETILLIEDEGVVREFTQRVLARGGYTIHAMADAAQALEFATSYAGQVDLVLSDVVLPGMNGRELADHLQERYPNCRVLFMSGYTDDAIVRHGVLEPGTWFLQKPFTATALLTKVRELLDADQPIRRVG